VIICKFVKVDYAEASQEDVTPTIIRLFLRAENDTTHGVPYLFDCKPGFTK